jgi:hypothetical protein
MSFNHEIGKPATRWMPKQAVGCREAWSRNTPKEIARRTGRRVTSVYGRRYTLGLPSLKPILRRWTPREDALFTRYPDKEVARRTGRSLIAVEARRRELHLPKLDSQRPRWIARSRRCLRFIRKRK